jgi:hypothetical protein
MTTPEPPPPGGDGPGRGLSGVQRAGIVLGALAVLLIVFVVLQGGDDSGSDSASSTPAQTTATQTTTTAQSTSTEDSATSTDDAGTGTTEPGDDNGSGGSGSDDAGSETGTTEDQPSAPAVQTVNVVNGQPRGGVERLEYTKGDRVRFKVRSDVADEIHVHGYDLMQDVEKGGSVTFSFTANIEGRFEIELENAGTQIAELEVKPA